MSIHTPKIVVIGGGTGAFALLSGLKSYTSDITALVNVGDTYAEGDLFDELGVLPPGDIRLSLVALSETSRTRDLFNYTFDEGALKHHNFGDLFLGAVEKMTDSLAEAVDLAAGLLRLEGRVLPLTTGPVRLIMEDGQGNQITGQARIGQINFGDKRRPPLAIEGTAALTPEAREAIHAADMVIIAPGNLYGSLAPALLTDGMGPLLRKTSAKIVYVANLVTKPGQTDGFMVHDYVAEIERFAGGPVVRYVVFNTDEPTPAMLKKYAREGEYPVEFDLETMDKAHYRVFGSPLIAREPIKGEAEGRHERSLIRHDKQALARELMRLYFV